MTLLFDFGGTLDLHGRHWFDFMFETFRRNQPQLDRKEFWDCYVDVERGLANSHEIVSTDTLRNTISKKIRHYADILSLSERVCEQTLTEIFLTVDRCMSTSKDILSVLSLHHRLAVVSNFYGNLECVLNEYGLCSHISKVFDSSVTGLRKPDTALFAFALQALGADASDTIMIGDSMKNDILPAKEQGLQTIHLCATCIDDANLSQALPHATVSTLSEVMELVREKCDLLI